MDAQTRYMAANKIETLDDLHADLAATEAELKKQEDIRRKLQNKIRRATPEKKEEYRAEKAKLTEAIAELRKRRKLAIAIEERSTRIDTALEQLMANEDRAQRRTQQKTRPNNEMNRNTRSIAFAILSAPAFRAVKSPAVTPSRTASSGSYPETPYLCL